MKDTVVAFVVEVYSFEKHAGFLFTSKRNKKFKCAPIFHAGRPISLQLAPTYTKPFLPARLLLTYNQYRSIIQKLLIA